MLYKERENDTMQRAAAASRVDGTNNERNAIVDGIESVGGESVYEQDVTQEERRMGSRRCK